MSNMRNPHRDTIYFKYSRENNRQSVKIKFTLIDSIGYHAAAVASITLNTKGTFVRFSSYNGYGNLTSRRILITPQEKYDSR